MGRICKKYSWLVFVESIKKSYSWEWRNSIVVCIWKGVWDRRFNNKLRVVVVYWYSYHDLFYFLLYHNWEWKQGFQTNKLLTCKSDWADCWPPIVSIPVGFGLLITTQLHKSTSYPSIHHHSAHGFGESWRVRVRDRVVNPSSKPLPLGLGLGLGFVWNFAKMVFRVKRTYLVLNLDNRGYCQNGWEWSALE